VKAVSPSALDARILDIFASRQGEGICVGDPHTFIRFGGCNVVCNYCDTPESIPAGSGTVKDLDRVFETISKLDPGHKTEEPDGS